MNRAFISLGSNMGNRLANLQRSTSLIAEKAGKVVLTSSLYETEPWQMALQTENFTNQVILIETELKAAELLKALLAIEEKLGRVRSINTGYQSRIIDLDILFYNNDQLSVEKLTIPHPFLHQRRFVLEPMAELAPDFVHPTLNKSIKTLLSECTDANSAVRIVSK